MLKRGENVSKNGDIGEKRKPYQNNPVKWTYRFLNLQRQDTGSYCFVAFLNNTRLSVESESLFLIQKYITFSNIRNCMLKRDMKFRPFYLFVRQFVYNLKIPLRNSEITPFKLLNISIASCQIFCWWIETEPLNKSILLSI